MEIKTMISETILEHNKQKINNLLKFVSDRLIFGIGRTKQATLWFYYINYCRYHHIGNEGKVTFRLLIEKLGGRVYWDKTLKQHWIEGVNIRPKPLTSVAGLKTIRLSDKVTSIEEHTLEMTRGVEERNGRVILQKDLPTMQVN